MRKINKLGRRAAALVLAVGLTLSTAAPVLAADADEVQTPAAQTQQQETDTEADEADVECDPIAPIVTAVDGATRQQVETAVEAADAIVTVTSATIDPLVVDTEAPGAPVVTTSVEGIGETCMATPAVATWAFRRLTSAATSRGSASNSRSHSASLRSRSARV